MNPRISVRTLLFIATGFAAAVALAQNAAIPASEDVYVLREFRVNTAKDDSFIATESTSGIRVATDILNLPQNPITSGYIWLPIEFEGDRPIIRWRNQWDLSVFSTP